MAFDRPTDRDLAKRLGRSMQAIQGRRARLLKLQAGREANVSAPPR